MSNLQNIGDPIKIPYPTEGIIRTANIDDTVTPENSVQLAINMNFDRIGAAQTRPGVTSFADTLVDGINNYGTLRNSIRPPGYDSIDIVGEQSNWVTPARFISAQKVDDDHIIVFWADNLTEDRNAQVMYVDQNTGGVTPVGTAFEFFSTIGTNLNCSIRISSTKFLNIWGGDSFTDVFARVFSVDPVTYAVTAAGAQYTFTAPSGAGVFGLENVDSNHVIAFYQLGSDIVASILEINTSTWAITQPGATLTVEAAVSPAYNKVARVSGTHFVNTWRGKIQCFSVNTGTWAITAIGTALAYDNAGSNYASLVSVGDGVHFVNFFKSNVTVNAGIAQVFNVNPSTFAVTTVGTPYQFASLANINAAVSSGDGIHFVNFWDNGTDTLFTQIFTLNTSTYNFTVVGSPLEIGSADNLATPAPVLMSQYKINTIWTEQAATSATKRGMGALFRMRGTLTNGRYLYAQSTDKVYNTVSGTWTSRRSGLAQVSKARFAQYLNYIWMVNGNETLGGNPVATSSGGAFGTDLVPEDFPPGDFISAGFEGRVWVLDKTLGIIHYTDIVQFTPPDVYTISYNPDVNFITTIAPQSGQQFTAVYQVPRALLVFTEDFIWRIYGASSLDAYPAYNVGTYSQESIVETQTGIFFHHSSGFYQFDYGSQPVEISRRIIDFVKAIPRSYYDDITGVYDGFDAVEWSVGPITVEGVTFANCVLRYTISTQVWTVYDYVGNTIKAMISFDNGTTLNHLMGTAAGLTGAMDTGTTDFGQSFYYEIIDRWRGFTESYSKQKSLDGVSIYTENAAGANVYFQVQKTGPNAWKPFGAITSENVTLLPNSDSDNFDAIRLRIAGYTSGAPVVIHGIEVLGITIKGYDQN